MFGNQTDAVDVDKIFFLLKTDIVGAIHIAGISLFKGLLSLYFIWERPYPLMITINKWKRWINEEFIEKLQ